MNNTYQCTKTWCIKHRHGLSFFPALTLIGLTLGTYKVTNGASWSFWFVLWLAAIIIPLILGMMEYVRFRWVLLWEAIMLFPLGLIAFIFFGSAILAMLKRT